MEAIAIAAVGDCGFCDRGFCDRGVEMGEVQEKSASGEGAKKSSCQVAAEGYLEVPRDAVRFLNSPPASPEIAAWLLDVESPPMPAADCVFDEEAAAPPHGAVPVQRRQGGAAFSVTRQGVIRAAPGLPLIVVEAWE